MDWAGAAVVRFGKNLSAAMSRHRDGASAAALAFFVMLAAAPAAIAVGAIAGLVMGPAQIKSAIDALGKSLHHLPPNAEPVVHGVESLITSASASTFTLTTVISLVVSLYAASKVIYELRVAISVIEEMGHTRNGFILRAISAVVTLLAAVIVTAVLVAGAVLPRILRDANVSMLGTLLNLVIVDWLLYVVMTWVVVVSIYALLGSARRKFVWTSPGPVVAALVIVSSTGGIGIYVSVSNTMGSAIALFGAPIIVLLWLYVGFLGLFAGAEIDSSWRKRSARPGHQRS